MVYYIFFSLISIIFSQDVFEGYVLYTPGGGGNATTVNNQIIGGTIKNNEIYIKDKIVLLK